MADASYVAIAGARDQGDLEHSQLQEPALGHRECLAEADLFELACSRIDTCDPVTAGRLFWTLGTFRKPVDAKTAAAVAATAARTIQRMDAQNFANTVWGIAWLQVAQRDERGGVSQVELLSSETLSVVAERAAAFVSSASPTHAPVSSRDSGAQPGLYGGTSANDAESGSVECEFDAATANNAVEHKASSRDTAKAEGRFCPQDYAMALSGIARLQTPLTPEQDAALVGAAEGYLPACNACGVRTVAWALSKLRQVRLMNIQMNIHIFYFEMSLQVLVGTGQPTCLSLYWLAGCEVGVRTVQSVLSDTHDFFSAARSLPCPI
jgi:hypothetical protein